MDWLNTSKELTFLLWIPLIIKNIYTIKIDLGVIFDYTKILPILEDSKYLKSKYYYEYGKEKTKMASHLIFVLSSN